MIEIKSKIMLSSEDIKLSVSSFEFSLFNHDQAIYCPACGYNLGTSPFNEGLITCFIIITLLTKRFMILHKIG